MMKNYTFKSPNKPRITQLSPRPQINFLRKPGEKKFTGNMRLVKLPFKKLFNRNKKITDLLPNPTQPTFLETPNGTKVKDILLDSSFNCKKTVKKPKRNDTIKDLISELEIENYREQIR